METFIQLVLKGKTVVGLPQSLHYNNKDYERSDAEDWMARVKEEVGEELAREKIILTWRQQNSFIKGQELYPLLNNRSEYLDHFAQVKICISPDFSPTLPSWLDLWWRRQSGTRGKRRSTFCFC